MRSNSARFKASWLAISVFFPSRSRVGGRRIGLRIVWELLLLTGRGGSREEAGSDGVCDLGACRMPLSASLALSSSSLVSCSPSWPSAIGLSLSFPVIKRCRIEPYIFDLEKVVVTTKLLVPDLILPFVMENFFRKKWTRINRFLSSHSAVLCVVKNVKHVLRDSISIWVLFRRRPRLR